MKTKDAKIGAKPSPNLTIIGKVFKDKVLKVRCKCICGNEKDMKLSSLGRTIKSCGCLSYITRFGGTKKRRGSLAENGFKRCSSCVITKSIEEYSRSASATDKLHHQCNECNRLNRLKRTYNITTEMYNNLLLKQNGKCAICEKSPEELKENNGKVRYLAIDHCHKTGKVRGLLCFKCNSSIGKLGDDCSIIYKAYLYLKNHNIINN